MAFFVAALILFLAMTDHSSGATPTYCLCKDGVSDQLLQKDIDYACGNGADCTQILQGATCYNPNTIKDHCNYAVNSFYQRKSQASGTCDFAATAIVSQTPPPNTISGCVYPSSPAPGIPGNTPTAPSISISPPGSPTPPGSISPQAGFGGIPPPGFGPGANGSGINPDNTGNGVQSIHHWSNLLASLALTLVISGLIWFTD